MLGVVFMVSRNKDNKHLLNFKQRTKTLLLEKADKQILDDLFNDFVRKGQDNEVSRMYISFNEINVKQLNKHLVTYLINNDFAYNPAKINSLLCSYAMQTDCLETKHWLFDYDSKDGIEDFVNEVSQYTDVLYANPTPNGYAVVTEHGFDTRDLLKKFEGVAENKRTNALLFYDIKTKVSD